jgi:hypothetical protein
MCCDRQFYLTLAQAVKDLTGATPALRLCIVKRISQHPLFRRDVKAAGS